MSLEKLIDLAARTGDKLIVHNAREGQDIVMMSVEAYESLLQDSPKPYRDVRELSSGQLIDQINRDIGIWRSEQGQEDLSEEVLQPNVPAFDLMPTMVNDDLDPPSDWHDTSEIISNKINNLSWDYPAHNETHDQIPSLKEEKVTVYSPIFHERQDNIPTKYKEQVPRDMSIGFESGIDWEDVPDDDPVFLEEPVQF